MARLLALLLLLASPAMAEDLLIGDLSRRRVDIRTSFSGTKLLLFGAVRADLGFAPEQGFDLVTVVTGPVRKAMVRKQSRRVGIWVSGAAVAYEAAPGYYAVAATRPLAEIAPPRLLRLYQIGLDTLDLAPAAIDPDEALYRAGLIRHRRAAGLYSEQPAAIELVGGRLFRTELALPATVPVGPYRVEVHLFQNGALMASTSLKLKVDKSGFERLVYDLAQSRPAVYAAIAVLIAVVSGWLAGTIFRK